MRSTASATASATSRRSGPIDVTALAHATEAGWDNGRLAAYAAELRTRYPLAERKGRILFVQIPQIILGSFNRDIALRRGYYAFPPTGLQYLYEAIKHRGLEVKILDLNYELLKRVFEDPDFSHENWIEILEAELAAYQPAIVGVSCLFDSGIHPLLESLRCVRRHGDAIAIAGGVISTYEWKRLIAPDLAHFAVRGEGENKLNFLLDHLVPDAAASRPTPGLFFDDGKGPAESVGPHDEVVIPGNVIDSHALVPIEDYCRYGSLNPYSRRADNPIPFAAIQFARGCRAECTFCAVRDFMGRGVRARSIEDVLGEMEYLYTQRGVRHFEWLDDDLLFYRREIKVLLRAIIAKGWDIRWSANNGLIAASIDDELLGLIRDSGCVGFKIGIETGNTEMLRKVKKPGKHSKFMNFSARLRDYPEVFVGGNFIVGLPGETFAQMMDTFRFALEIEIDWAAITVCQIIRGASAFTDAGEYFEDQMRSDGLKIKNFIPSRNSSAGQIAVGEGVLRNLDVFRLAAETLPDEDQVKEIWFTFNLLINYMNNKNLMAGGDPQKFINWVSTAQRAYPNNPYMMLFLGLAERLLGHDEAAESCRERAASFVNSDYWRERFARFHLDGLLADFPKDAAAVRPRLAAIWAIQRRACADWLGVPRGTVPGAAFAARALAEAGSYSHTA